MKANQARLIDVADSAVSGRDMADPELEIARIGDSELAIIREGVESIAISSRYYAEFALGMLPLLDTQGRSAALLLLANLLREQLARTSGS